MIINNLDFEKMHGLGNDYILINDLNWNIPDEKKSLVAKKLCKSHFSIGADGLIFICESDKADIRMRIFNDDGSEAEMCGNGIRCFAKYIYENEIVKRSNITVETLKGVLITELTITDGIVQTVKIDMGPPILKCEDVPVISLNNQDKCVNESIEVLDKTFIFTAVSMGNPHAVIFTDQIINDEDLVKYGQLIEKNDRFPKKINVQFVKIISGQKAVLRVFERGVGVTNSCGTGTCAAVVAGTILGKFTENTPITVHNDGGDLTITYNGETVFMEGPIERAFKGIVERIEI